MPARIWLSAIYGSLAGLGMTITLVAATGVTAETPLLARLSVTTVAGIVGYAVFLTHHRWTRPDGSRLDRIDPDADQWPRPGRGRW